MWHIWGEENKDFVGIPAKRNHLQDIDVDRSII